MKHTCNKCGRTLNIYNIGRPCCRASLKSVMHNTKLERKAWRKKYWANKRAGGSVS